MHLFPSWQATVVEVVDPRPRIKVDPINPHIEIFEFIWVFPKIGVKPPQWMVYNGKAL